MDYENGFPSETHIEFFPGFLLQCIKELLGKNVPRIQSKLLSGFFASNADMSCVTNSRRNLQINPREVPVKFQEEFRTNFSNLIFDLIFVQTLLGFSQEFLQGYLLQLVMEFVFFEVYWKFDRNSRNNLRIDRVKSQKKSRTFV